MSKAILKKSKEQRENLTNYDYFEDFKFYLEDSGIKNQIAKVKEIEEGAIVGFTLGS